MEHSRRSVQLGDLIRYKRALFSTGEERWFVGYISSIDQPFAKMTFLSPIIEGMPQKAVLYLDDDKPEWIIL
jgi:hypothetical protein